MTRIIISATNPCHLYDLAREWHQLDVLGSYHSGYPGWKLHPPASFPLNTHSWRTIASYGALRLPRSLRPKDETLYHWQDRGFDRAVAINLSKSDGELIHSLPGQALATFQAARRLGLETCLNHASGPLKQQHEIIVAQNARDGLPTPPPPSTSELERRAAESTLADWHCAASSIVRDQLIVDGIPAERIWTAPYGADIKLFHPSGAPRSPGQSIIYAGQITARKGLGILFEAIGQLKAMKGLSLDCYGPDGADAASFHQLAATDSRIRLHGAVSQHALAEHFRQSDLLVLPSWEEAFGLVVPQALNCQLPVVVSDRVGAKDIIRTRENGSIFPAGEANALKEEILWWLNNPEAFHDEPHTWERPARSLLKQMTERKRCIST